MCAVGLLHGAFATASRAAFAAKDGAHGWLPKGKRHALADLFQTLREADGDSRLALARRSRGDGGDEDELALLWPVFERLEGDLGFVPPIEGEMIVRDAERVSEDGDVLYHVREWKARSCQEAV